MSSLSCLLSLISWAAKLLAMPCRSWWQAEGLSSAKGFHMLQQVGDARWVLQQCLTSIAPDYSQQTALLQYGLQLTAEHCTAPPNGDEHTGEAHVLLDVMRTCCPARAVSLSHRHASPPRKLVLRQWQSCWQSDQCMAPGLQAAACRNTSQLLSSSGGCSSLPPGGFLYCCDVAVGLNQKSCNWCPAEEVRPSEEELWWLQARLQLLEQTDSLATFSALFDRSAIQV